MTVRLDLTPHARASSVRGSASACLLATSARQQWGGQWAVERKGITHTSGGVQTHYRHTLGSWLAAAAYDFRLPYAPRSVRISRSKMSYRDRRMLRRAAGWSIVGLGGWWLFFGPLVPATCALLAVGFLGTRAVMTRMGAAAPANTATALPALSELRAMAPADRQAVLAPRPAEALRPAPAQTTAAAPPAWPEAGRLPARLPQSPA